MMMLILVLVFFISSFPVIDAMESGKSEQEVLDDQQGNTDELNGADSSQYADMLRKLADWFNEPVVQGKVSIYYRSKHNDNSTREGCPTKALFNLLKQIAESCVVNPCLEPQEKNVEFEDIKQLLNEGADPNMVFVIEKADKTNISIIEGYKVDIIEMPLLYSAVMLQNKFLFKLLIERGVDVECRFKKFSKRVCKVGAYVLINEKVPMIEYSIFNMVFKSITPRTNEEEKVTGFILQLLVDKCIKKEDSWFGDFDASSCVSSMYNNGFVDISWFAELDFSQKRNRELLKAHLLTLGQVGTKEKNHRLTINLLFRDMALIMEGRLLQEEEEIASQHAQGLDKLTKKLQLIVDGYIKEEDDRFINFDAHSWVSGACNNKSFNWWALVKLNFSKKEDWELMKSCLLDGISCERDDN